MFYLNRAIAYISSATPSVSFILIHNTYKYRKKDENREIQYMVQDFNKIYRFAEKQM